MLSVFAGKQTVTFENNVPADAEEIVTFRDREPETIAWIEAMPLKSVFWDVGAGVGLYYFSWADRRRDQSVAKRVASPASMTLLTGAEVWK